jgi:hypothetical protein
MDRGIKFGLNSYIAFYVLPYRENSGRGSGDGHSRTGMRDSGPRPTQNSFLQDSGGLLQELTT